MITNTTPVWKVGSRWDAQGHWAASILDVFHRYKIVFVGAHANRFQLIQKNDLIAIADGYRVVAFGVVTTEPKPVSEMGISFSSEDRIRFDLHDGVMGCKVKITEIDPNKPLSLRVRSAVCRVRRDAQMFRDYYQQLHQDYHVDQKFQIEARSCTLLSPDDQDSSKVLR